ncbi:MAG TPA: TetR/AcrR family transcriptional regulator, partial [Alcanivorax sp.]|nr:TetR/AcrR family transcriptional regulator [Alcanivorax sp.]HCQ37157.1 TetR/AcrR family transcriptional regulator [Alcanivorax sp.]
QRLEQCRRTMIGIAESVVLGADATPGMLERPQS